MQDTNGDFDLVKVLNDDKYLEHFEVPINIPEDVKELYPYAKLCGKNPYISIMGSSSVGKSSFINTLSGKEVIPYNISNTISIPILISKDDDRIIINTLFSQIINLNIDYLDNIIDQIRHNPDNYRRSIEFIVLNYKEFPYENITFVDTPGYSGVDANYAISKSMIDVSDAVIFLFDASKGSLTDEDLDILEYAKGQKADIFVIANKIDKVWENRQEILNLAIKSLEDRNIDIVRNICYFSNDSEGKKKIDLEFKFIKNFIYKVAQKKYIKLAEISSEYWNNKGMALFNLSRYDEALQYFDKAIDLEPDNAEYWNNMGVTLYKLSRYEDVLKCFDKAIDLEPDIAEYLEKKGDVLYELSRYEEALKCFDKAIDLEPDIAEYWGKKGDVLYKLSRYEEALKCCEEAIDLEPDNAEYWGKKGDVLYKLSRYEEALKCFDKAIDLEPDNAEYLEKKGDVLSKLSRYREALKYTHEALQHAELWGKKGDTSYKLSSYKLAIKCYDRAIKLEPNNAEYWGKKGAALYALRLYEDALKCFDKAIDLEPNNAEYWRSKSAVLVALLRFDEADKCMEIAKNL